MFTAPRLWSLNTKNGLRTLPTAETLVTSLLAGHDYSFMLELYIHRPC